MSICTTTHKPVIPFSAETSPRLVRPSCPLAPVQRSPVLPNGDLGSYPHTIHECGASFHNWPKKTEKGTYVINLHVVARSSRRDV